MIFHDVTLSAWTPTINAHLYRPGPRSRFDRDIHYEDIHDYTTLIYDAFWSEKGREIRLVCPPPENLTVNVLAGEFHEIPSGRRCKVTVERVGHTHMLRVPVSRSTRALNLVSPLGNYHVTPQANLCDAFAGERILITQNKNNPLNWIRDWAHFHVEMHGATSVLFYDNGSHRYGKYDIRAAFETVPGLKKLALIDAPFPFGPARGAQRVNESRYFHRAYLDQAKFRLFNRARSIIHIDVDELVVSPAGESIFEAIEQSSTGAVTFPGIWVERVTPSGIEPEPGELSHVSFRHVLKGGGRPTAVKSGLVPARLQPLANFNVHQIYGARSDEAAGQRFLHRHFMGLKTVETHFVNVRRLGIHTFEKADPGKHEVDTVLSVQLDRVFGSDRYRAMAPVAPYAHPTDGETCRRFAGQCAGRGDYEGAIGWMQRAVQLLPDYPSYHEYLARCLERVGRPEEAAEAHAQAEELRLASPEVQLHRLRQLRVAGQPEHESLMRGLGARFPESADIQEKYGEWLHHNGDRDGAEAAFRKAVDLAPNDAAKLIRLARALPRGGRAEAIALYRRALALPEAPVLVRVRAYDRLARTLQAEERHPEAVAVLREGLQVLGSVADAKTLGDWTAAVEAMGGHVPAPPPVSPAQVSGWQRVTAQVVSALRRSGLGRTL